MLAPLALQERRVLRATPQWCTRGSFPQKSAQRTRLRHVHARKVRCVNARRRTSRILRMWDSGIGGSTMGERVAMLIIEPRSLVREALVSLMASHSYRVVCAVASAAEIDSSSLGADVPKLVIVGALP